MKVHIGVDAVTGLAHSVFATSANVADVTMVRHLVREDGKRIDGDTGCFGMGKYLVEEKQSSETRCFAPVRRSAIKKMEDSWKKTLMLAFEKTKTNIYAKVEHPFHVIKNLFGYRKVCYKGLTKKNQAQLFSLFALANLVLAGRCQQHVHGGSVS